MDISYIWVIKDVRGSGSEVWATPDEEIDSNWVSRSRDKGDEDGDAR
jgi:hypothetical protein